MIYTFRCRKCDTIVTCDHSILQQHPSRHECGGELQRIFDTANVIYRGGGFYTTEKRLDVDEKDAE